jgi:hypothetical protein
VDVASIGDRRELGGIDEDDSQALCGLVASASPETESWSAIARISTPRV